jgi:hypothetical protein
MPASRSPRAPAGVSTTDKPVARPWVISQEHRGSPVQVQDCGIQLLKGGLDVGQPLAVLGGQAALQRHGGRIAMCSAGRRLLVLLRICLPPASCSSTTISRALCSDIVPTSSHRTGTVEMLRLLRVARATAMKARTQAINALAPEQQAKDDREQSIYFAGPPQVVADQVSTDESFNASAVAGRSWRR